LICALAERDADAATNAAIAAGANPPFIDEAVNFSRPFVEGFIARVAKDHERHDPLSLRPGRNRRKSSMLNRITVRRCVF